MPNNKPPQWVSATQPVPTKISPGKLKEDVQVGELTLHKGTVVKAVTQTKMERNGCDEWQVDMQVCQAWTTKEFLEQAEKVRIPW